MAAKPGPGSAASPGCAGAMERVLPMLLVQIPAEETAQLGSRAQLHRRAEALGSLTAAGSLQVLSLAPGSRGGSSCCLQGPFGHFVWEDSCNSGTSTDKPTLLAVSEDYELRTYEFDLKDGRCDAALSHSCCGRTLQKLIEDQGVSVSFKSLRILSFHNKTALLLINRCLILRVVLPGRESENRVLDCFPLPLPAQTADTIIDVQLCGGFLFVLSTLGWIYIFDTANGIHVAHVDLALLQEDSEQQEPASVSSFTSLKVSPDLGVLVIVSSSNTAVALNLNLYFRQHPGHLLCEQTPEDLPIEGPTGIDEDDLVNSVHNMKLTKVSFQVDRSWRAQLSTLNETTRHSKPEVSCCAPWFQSVLRLESPESGNHTPIVPDHALIPGDVTCGQCAFPQEHIKTNDPRRPWETMHLSEQEQPSELKCMSVTGFTALFTQAVGTTSCTIVLWDLETQSIQCFSLSQKCAPVDSNGDQQLCLVLTENGLSLILFGVTQEEFLNRLMIHGSASTVDSLCHLNGWGRCSIPIHALEAGIENRQLDTVDFFLKSKENLLTPSSRSVPDQLHPFPSQLYLRQVEEMTPALGLLCSAIRESDSETQSKQFAEQMLHLTLSFLNRQIKELFVHTTEIDEHLQKGVDILTSYINELRTFMIKFPWKPADAIDEYDVNKDVLTVKEGKIWEKLSFEEVIADAILNNKIPEAQTFFRITGHSAQRLEELVRIGLDLVFGRLKENNVEEASMLLRNMGFSVEDELLKICFHTTDKNIRDFLVEILKGKECFSEKERRTVDFVHQVEKFYSGHFQENVQIASFPSYWIKEQDYFKHKPVLDTFLKCDQKDEFNEQDHRIALNWAHWWDQQTQECILLPRISPEEYKACSPDALWKYLTVRHDWSNLSLWIEEFQTQETVPPQQNKWPPLSADIIDQNTCCNRYMRNKILDKLARSGIFLASELEDFELFLLRLSRIGGIMRDNFPVQSYKSSGGWDFHSHFIHYCLEHGLQHLLYVYLDYYKLSPGNCPFLEKKEVHEAHPWLEFLVQCRQVSSNLTDPKLIFQASLANAQILIPTNQASVSSMLLEGHTLLALATTMYAPGGVSQLSGEASLKLPSDLGLLSASSLDSQSSMMLPSTDEVARTLRGLTSKCLHGKSYCRQVLCLYELAKELGCSYADIAARDSEAMLRTILASQRPDRCRQAQVFISTQGIKPDTVAELVAEEVTRELLTSSERTGEKQPFNPAEESQTFLQLTAVCQDRTLVGMKLLDKIPSVPYGELSCTTELLILAHHCFTFTCHMEGIIRVLQAARMLTDNHLAPNEEYGLVVRLLTGIGRYNEMTYIFDLLHQKHYFEVLMRKKLDPSGTLKTALLDYIKRCRPGDSEKHNMIALCFSMCREIGENHEAAACIQLKMIESQPWEESLKDGAQLKQLLLKALTLMLDAAESYAKDSCVRQALHCNRLTKLITLQIHFLNTGQNTMLINLGHQKLMDCIMALPRFYQASIVAEAYDFVPDWAEVLYQQVILKGDFSYLEEFKQQKLLRPNIFEDISKKYKQHQPTDRVTENLKKLLSYCEDIYLHYKLAYEHKFFEIVNVLLKDPQTGCCLKDMLAG
ncbi:LOW QUALITY PROTEIN: spatacsin [Onychomys torridus]|uniref:LOW QUALITY PROTEIN: spatacsin n=1 Tax=Onychomys torridus TaxID=38674 RepID=UPI00167F5596|nr:LOW QUALITY PROTEIN: spatacsin [Onychomys torridus]